MEVAAERGHRTRPFKTWARRFVTRRVVPAVPLDSPLVMLVMAII